MTLKINEKGKKIAKWVVVGILAVLILVFLIKTAVWENNYYREKEGSERAAAVMLGGDEELIEEEPTEAEVREWTVAADRPRYLTIPRLNIYNARILPMSVNARGELATPNNIFDVGWYTASSKPGEGGTVVIDGHNGGPHVVGVFKYLPNLEAGDMIRIERGDGAVFNYQVVENVTVALDDANAYMSTAMRSPVAGKEAVTLISCTGEWSTVRDTYLSRQFTRAVLLEA